MNRKLRAALEHVATAKRTRQGEREVMYGGLPGIPFEFDDEAALAQWVLDVTALDAGHIERLENAVLEYIEWDEGLGECRYCQSYLKSGDGHNEGCVVLEVIERRLTNV